jgi:hypothetical protein
MLHKCIKQHNINYQKGSLSSLSYLRDDYRKQAILIFESHSDSNRCTPYREKLDQHDTYATHTSPRMPGIRFLRVVPIRDNLSWIIDTLEQGDSSREKGLPTQSTARRLTNPWVRTQCLSQANLEAVGEKPSIRRWQATSLTGPISPTCDRYVQYLLAGASHRFLTNIGGGYSLEGASFPHTTSQPSQPMVLPFIPKGLARSPDYPKSTTDSMVQVKGTYGRHVVFRPLSHLP